MSDERRRDEKSLKADFEQARPGLLGLLLTGVSEALANVESIEPTEKPRMLDFARWAAASMKAFD